MKLLPQATSNTVLIFLAIVVSLSLLSGCVSQVNRRAFEESAPRRLGLVIGHDIKAVSSMTNQEEAWVAISFGLIGVAVLEATAKEWTLDFAEQINEMVQERVIGQMREKGYSMQFLCAKPTKWNLFESISDTPDAYANLVKKHNPASIFNDVDSILFIEYLLEGRLEGRFLETPRLEDLSIENMKAMYAKSKVWLYDTRSGKRLFHNTIQKGYPSYPGTSVAEALDALTNLESIPEVAEE
jgi:hypothetical protein